MFIPKSKPFLEHSPMLLPDNLPRCPGMADPLFRLVRLTHLQKPLGIVRNHAVDLLAYTPFHI